MLHRNQNFRKQESRMSIQRKGKRYETLYYLHHIQLLPYVFFLFYSVEFGVNRCYKCKSGCLTFVFKWDSNVVENPIFQYCVRNKFKNN